MVSGIIYRMQGTMKMAKLGGLHSTYPRLSVLMAIVLFSLVGIPPLSGFWPKINLFQAGFMEGNYILIGGMIIASFATLYVIAKMWTEVFWKDRDPAAESEDGFALMKRSDRILLVAPVVFLTVVSLYIGFGAENIMVVSKHIAAQMLDSEPYIQAVLGK